MSTIACQNLVLAPNKFYQWRLGTVRYFLYGYRHCIGANQAAELINFLYTLKIFVIKAFAEPYMGSLVKKMDVTWSPEFGVSVLSCLDEIRPQSRSTLACSGETLFFSLAPVNMAVFRVFFFGRTFLKKSLVTLYKIERKMKIEVFSFILVYSSID